MRVWVAGGPLGTYEVEAATAALRRRGHVACFGPPEPAAGAALAGAAPLTDDDLDTMPGLHAVVRYARGRSDPAPEAARVAARGVAYRLVSGVSARSTAEHTVALMLASLRGLPLDAGGQWCREGDHRIDDLADTRVGLVGMGAVGRAVAGLLAAFGSEVRCAVRRTPPPSGMRAMPLADLVAWCDVVSLHSRNATGAPLLTGALLASMRDGALVVNTGDGRDVDLDALRAELATGRLRAALDVLPEEPGTCEGALLTPHVAGRSRGTATRLFEAAAAALDEALTPGPAPCAGLLAEALSLIAGGLAGVHVQVPRELARLAPALRRAGATTADRAGGPPVLVGERDGRRFRVLATWDVAAGTDGHVSTAAVPTLRHLRDRYAADHTLWSRLLAPGVNGVLPGRESFVTGYGPLQRTTAWRARELGMRVRVLGRAPDVLDALYDGFEAVETPPPGALCLDAVPDPGDAPPALDEALDAATLLALAAAARYPDTGDAVVECDRALAVAVVAVARR